MSQQTWTKVRLILIVGAVVASCLVGWLLPRGISLFSAIVFPAVALAAWIETHYQQAELQPRYQLYAIGMTVVALPVALFGVVSFGWLYH